MPGRKFTSGSEYRYGFNGKENDKDAGEGVQDYGMRIYDSRLGRFLSVDPITSKYPELTPYQFASNRPIDGIDEDGLEYTTGKQSTLPDFTPPPARRSFVSSCSTYVSPSTHVSANTPVASKFAITQVHSEVQPGMPKPQPKIEDPVQKPIIILVRETPSLTSVSSYVSPYQKAEQEAQLRSFRAANGLDPNTGESFEDKFPRLAKVGERTNESISFGINATSFLIGVGEAYGTIRGATIAAETVGSGAQYSVAFEMKLASSSYPGVYRGAHFLEANKALSATMATDARFASSMSQLGINIPRSSAGSILGKSPANWVWHHDVSAGIMQLVPKTQHTIGSSFWNTLHPGGVGGFSIWGK